jgi:hypothetical protein
MARKKRIEDEVADLVKDAKPARKPRSNPKLAVVRDKVSQVAIGNGITQVGGNVTIKTTRAPNLVIGPPPGSIGADSFLKQRIKALFNELGEARAKRYPDTAFNVMYKKFKDDFGIKHNKWTIIWEWPEAAAQEIIDYLEAKIANTIPGRVKKAAQRPGYRHTRQQLMARENQLLQFLGATTRSPQVKDLLKEKFGVTSHTQLTYEQHLQIIAYFQALVTGMEHP